MLTSAISVTSYIKGVLQHMTRPLEAVYVAVRLSIQLYGCAGRLFPAAHAILEEVHAITVIMYGAV